VLKAYGWKQRNILSNLLIFNLELAVRQENCGSAPAEPNRPLPLNRCQEQGSSSLNGV